MKIPVHCAPTWLTLKKATNSIVGKCILILSIAIPLAKLTKLGISFPALNLAALGAIFCLIGWGFTIFFIPTRIRDHEDGYCFANQALDRHRVSGFNIAIELQWVSSHTNINDAIKKCQLPDDFLTKFRLGGSAQTDESTIYYYSRIAYECDNFSGTFLRIISTMVTMIGVAMLYNSAIESSYIIIKEVLHVN